MIHEINRRHFIRTSALMLPLPLLPSLVRAADRPETGTNIKRVCFLNLGHGLLPENFFPEKSGTDYGTSLYLRHLDPVRERFTVFSGLSHGLSNHTKEHGILSGVAAGNKTGALSIDQAMAGKLGTETRFESLAVWPFAKSNVGTPSISYNPAGVGIPPIKTPQALYEKLFLNNIPAKERKAQLANIQRNKSILDGIRSDRNQLDRLVNGNDRRSLDEYYQAVRDAERKLTRAADWIDKPKPTAPMKSPRRLPEILDLDVNFGLLLEQEMELMYLALLTDSTRVITFHHGISDAPMTVDGVTSNAHRSYSHHGQEPEKLEKLARIEGTVFKKVVADFLVRLAKKQENGEALLDSTMVCALSNLGQPANHSGQNLPVLVAGAGFERDHGKHIAYDQERNEPLCNLFLTMLHKLEIDEPRFGTSTGPLKGLA
jgi:hypothetical protein